MEVHDLETKGTLLRPDLVCDSECTMFAGKIESLAVVPRGEVVRNELEDGSPRSNQQPSSTVRVKVFPFVTRRISGGKKGKGEVVLNSIHACSENQDKCRCRGQKK